MKVAVLTGGFSSEREISLITGNAIANALKKNGHSVRTIDITSSDIGTVKALWKQKIFELAFIAIHGEFGEDGELQKLLDAAGIPYTGSGAKASMLAMNKYLSKTEFLLRDVNTPKYLIYNETALDEIILRLDLPVVVKPVTEGSSIGVSINKTKEELAEGIEKAKRFEPLIIEKYIAGREMNVAILDGKALPIIEIKPRNAFYDYDAKYNSHDTEYIVDPELSAEQEYWLKTQALKAYRALGCESYARVDLLLSENGLPYVLEVNTIPGMTPTSLFPKAAKAAGLSFEELCEKIANLALAKHKRTRAAA